MGKVHVCGSLLHQLKTLTRAFLTRDFHSWGRIPLTSLHFFSDNSPSHLHNPFYFPWWCYIYDLTLFFKELSGIGKIRMISKANTWGSWETAHSRVGPGLMANGLPSGQWLFAQTLPLLLSLHHVVFWDAQPTEITYVWVIDLVIIERKKLELNKSHFYFKDYCFVTFKFSFLNDHKVECVILDGAYEAISSRLRTFNHPSLSPMGHAYYYLCCFILQSAFSLLKFRHEVQKSFIAHLPYVGFSYTSLQEYDAFLLARHTSGNTNMCTAHI